MRTKAASTVFVVLTATLVACADEGMWRIIDPPREVRELGGTAGPRIMVSGKIILSNPKVKAPKVDRDVTVINQRTFYLPLRIDPKVRAKLQCIRLLVSHDRGKTWKEQRDPTPHKHYFTVSVPHDGMYWYAVQTESKDGTKVPADTNNLEPLKIFVNSENRGLQGGAGSPPGR